VLPPAQQLAPCQAARGDPPNEEIGDPAAYPEWLADSSPTWAFHQIEELLDEGP